MEQSSFELTALQLYSNDRLKVYIGGGLVALKCGLDGYLTFIGMVGTYLDLPLHVGL